MKQGAEIKKHTQKNNKQKRTAYHIPVFNPLFTVIQEESMQLEGCHPWNVIRWKMTGGDTLHLCRQACVITLRQSMEASFTSVEVLRKVALPTNYLLTALGEKNLMHGLHVAKIDER